MSSLLRPPKKPIVSYMFYCNLNRDRVSRNNPGLKMTQISTILGREWNALSDAQKLFYQQLAADDKSRYERELAVYAAQTNTSVNFSHRRQHSPAAPLASSTKRPVAQLSSAPPAIIYRVICPMCRAENRVSEEQPTARGDNFGECAVCLDQPVQVFLPQCGHTCICWSCVRDMKQ